MVWVGPTILGWLFNSKSSPFSCLHQSDPTLNPQKKLWMVEFSKAASLLLETSFSRSPSSSEGGVSCSHPTILRFLGLHCWCVFQIVQVIWFHPHCTSNTEHTQLHVRCSMNISFVFFCSFFFLHLKTKIHDDKVRISTWLICTKVRTGSVVSDSWWLVDGSPQGFSLHGIFQARILGQEHLRIFFSRTLKSVRIYPVITYTVYVLVQ